MKKISILGSTGSIGRQTLDVVRNHPEEFKVVGLACRSDSLEIKKQIREFKPEVFSIAEKDGQEGILRVATWPSAEIVVVAVVGLAGLLPTLEAIKASKDIALATKEVLVSAGGIVTELARKKRVKILPVDSEHSAIFQCLNNEDKKTVAKIILTCSGGPFRGKTKKELKEMRVGDALAHPTWKMGKKITIDSATLMNKGFEVLEAKWLFSQDLNKIGVVIHPQSLVHSLVEFVDGNIIAQLGPHDMRLPIQYALSFPQRIANNFPRLDLIRIKNLTFEKPDIKTFPCLVLATQAAKTGGTLPVVLNAANEVAVDFFLKGRVKFLEIPRIIERAMWRHKVVLSPCLEEILMTDSWARKEVIREVEK